MFSPYPDDDDAPIGSGIISPDWIHCEECGVLIPLDSMGFPYQHTCSHYTVTVDFPLSVSKEIDEWWLHI